MDIAVLGIHFKTSPFLVREMATQKMRLCLDPVSCVWLITCNRVEAYIDERVLPQMQDWFTAISPDAYVYVYRGWECFLHLCKVASGLDSAVLGETEILHQVKTAYVRAIALSSVLHYAFQKAFHVAKGCRHHFPMDRKMGSLSSTLWQMILEVFPAPMQRRVLLVGYSRIHRELASFLRYKGMMNIAFCTRSSLPMDNVRSRSELVHWPSYDIISCATHAEKFLIHGQSDKWHLLFDLSMPRVIDPAIQGPHLQLFNLEAIHARAHCNAACLQDFVDEALHALTQHARCLYQLYEQKQALKNLHVLGI